MRLNKVNGPGVCPERFVKHDTPKWLTNLCPGGFQHSVTWSPSPSNKNTDSWGQKNWVGTQTLTEWTKRVIVGSGAISPALWPLLRTLIDGERVISRYDRVLWRVGLLSCWWLNVSTCGLCLCAEERDGLWVFCTPSRSAVTASEITVKSCEEFIILKWWCNVGFGEERH